MTENAEKDLLEQLKELRFDVQDALLKVQQDKPIDMSGIDERVEHCCQAVLEEHPLVRDEAEPIMTEIIASLEKLAYALQDAIDSDEDQDDWDEETYPDNGSDEGKS